MSRSFAYQDRPWWDNDGVEWADFGERSPQPLRVAPTARRPDLRELDGAEPDAMGFQEAKVRPEIEAEIYEVLLTWQRRKRAFREWSVQELRHEFQDAQRDLLQSLSPEAKELLSQERYWFAQSLDGVNVVFAVVVYPCGAVAVDSFVPRSLLR